MDENEKKTQARTIVENSAWNFVTSIITRAGALVSTILLARYLLPERYGLYSLALAVALFFMTLENLGIDYTLVRYFSFALGKNNKKQARAYYKYLLRIKTIVVIVVSLA